MVLAVASVIVRNGDKKVCVLEDSCGFIINLVVTTEDGCLEVIGMGSNVVIPFISVVGNLSYVSIQLRDRVVTLTAIVFIMSSLVYFVDSK